MKLMRMLVPFMATMMSAFLLQSCGGGGGGTPPAGGPTAPPSTAALKVSTGSSRASFHNMKMAFNNAGKGVIVWEEQTGTNNRILWAYFDGTTLQPETELAPYATRPAVATNGADFMLVWSYGRIYAASVSSGGSLGTPAIISDWNSDIPDIVSNGSGYAVAWRGYKTGTWPIYVNIYSSSTWTAALVVDTVPGTSDYPKMASNGAGYAVTWRKDTGPANDIYASVSSGGTGTATWQAPSLLENLSGMAYYPSIASNGSGYAVIWAQNDGVQYSVFANIYSAGTWSAVGTLLETSALGLNDMANMVIASNGSGYAAAWSQHDGTNVSTYANIYSGGSWSTAVVIDISPNGATQVSIASSGSGYAVAWQQDNLAVHDIYASLYSAGSWSAPVLLDTGTSDAWEPMIVRFPTGYAAAWHQSDAGGNATLFGSVYAGGGWSSPTQIVQGVWKGTGWQPRLSTNKNGASLAVWLEYHAERWRLFGSTNATGAWSPPFLIDADTGLQAAVATNGSSFMVIWHSYTLNAPAAVTCASDGTLGIPVKLGGSNGNGANYLGLASNGTGYAAVWYRYDSISQYNIYANVYSNGTWSNDGGGNPTPWLIEDGPNYATNPSIASNGSGYAAVWSQSDGINYNIYANLFSSGSWSTGGTLLENIPGQADAPSIASNGSGYAASWSQFDGAVYSIYANIYSAGSWSTGGTLLENSATADAYAPRVASNGNGYAVTWQLNDVSASSIYANVYSGGTWSTGATLLEGGVYDAVGPAVASNRDGYAVSWTQYDGAFYRTYMNIFSAGTWSIGGTAVDPGGSESTTAVITSNGNKYSVIWMQQDPADRMMYDVWAKLGI